MDNKNMLVAIALMLSLILIAPNITAANGYYLDDNFRGSTRTNLFSRTDSAESTNGQTYTREDYQRWVIKWYGYVNKNNGVVTSKSSTGFTFTHRNKTYTVDVAGANLFKAPNNDLITFRDIHVGDRVIVKGTRTNDVINATDVYIIPSNFEKVNGRAIVSAVNNDGTFSVKARNGQDIKVVVVENATVTESRTDNPSLSNVQVGSKLQLRGFWDPAANVFYAVKVHISKL